MDWWMGLRPSVSELPEWGIFSDGGCPNAHFLAYVNGAGD